MTTVILPERHYPQTIGANQVYWLLTIWYGTEIVRLSTANLDIADAVESTTHRYHHGLGDVRYSEPATFPQDISEGVSVALEVVMPVNVAELEARGRRLEGARAELARWVYGADFSERRIVAVGEVADPLWGAEYEPVSFSIESLVYRDTALIPFENQRVSSETWSTTDTLDSEEVGVYYPIVFGAPGKVSATVIPRGWITGSQGCWVDRTTTNSALGPYKEDLRLVIAGHPVAADRVYLSNSEDPTGDRFVVSQGTDSRGQVVSYIDATVTGDPPTSSADFSTTDPNGTSYGLGSNGVPEFHPYIADSGLGPYGNGVAPFYVGWLNDSGTGGEGGWVGKDGAAARNALEIVEVLLGFTRRPIDHGRFAAAAPLAAGFKLDFTIDAQTQPWPFIRDEILPLLPVSIVTGPDGRLAPIWWRYDARVGDAVAHLNADVDPYIERASRVRVDSSEIKNDFTIKYAMSVRKDSYYATRRLTAGPYDSDDPNTHVSLFCRLSQHRYRYADGSPRISEDKIETALVYEDATAQAIMAWKAACYALARKKISYVVPERDWAWLERGAVVTLTDSELFIDGWVCLVTDIQIDDSGMMGVELLRVEQPPRDGARFG